MLAGHMSLGCGTIADEMVGSLFTFNSTEMADLVVRFKLIYYMSITLFICCVLFYCLFIYTVFPFQSLPSGETISDTGGEQLFENLKTC